MDKQRKFETSGWIARDRKDEEGEEDLYFYTNKPTLCKLYGMWHGSGIYWKMPSEWFPEIIAERDCIPIKLNFIFKEVDE